MSEEQQGAKKVISTEAFFNDIVAIAYKVQNSVKPQHFDTVFNRAIDEYIKVGENGRLTVYEDVASEFIRAIEVSRHPKAKA